MPVGLQGLSRAAAPGSDSSESGVLPSWAWPLLQSAAGPLNQPSLVRLSWDSFSRAPPPTSSSRVHSQLSEDNLRQLATTRAAWSVLVVSHHLDGLLRVTTPGVLQPEPAGVRCVAGTTDPHRLASQTRRHKVSAVPAARAPFEEPSSSTAGVHLSMARSPPAVASHEVQARRPYPHARPTTGRCSVDASGHSTSPLPAPTECPRPSMGFCACSTLRPKPKSSADVTLKSVPRCNPEGMQRLKRLLEIGRAHV